MLDQSFRPSERAVPVSACRYLKRYALPPPGTVVQLGHYEGAGDFIATAHNRMYARKVANREDAGPADAFRAAMRIHRLVIGVTVIDGAPITPRRLLASWDDSGHRSVAGHLRRTCPH